MLQVIHDNPELIIIVLLVAAFVIAWVVWTVEVVWIAIVMIRSAIARRRSRRCP
ncbi:hypothetical protein [Gordonia soli]|uniref:Uncharacterized protein n=1 Tax=Gordonia soli NBRC 108243 TaxID=1223545 RepID=M0QQ44_9ACTN|nr:hypothetical protein [Gordonia soli]GAC70810.1 hypothetical protein GS4_41_00580 [Gordonia soli NBRC 108243]